MPVYACHEPPCPPGIAVADASAHTAWHAEMRERGPSEHDVTVGDVIAAWLDDLDVTAIEQLVLAAEPTMSDNPVAGTLDVLRKLAREP